MKNSGDLQNLTISSNTFRDIRKIKDFELQSMRHKFYN